MIGLTQVLILWILVTAGYLIVESNGTRADIEEKWLWLHNQSPKIPIPQGDERPQNYQVPIFRIRNRIRPVKRLRTNSTVLRTIILKRVPPPSESVQARVDVIVRPSNKSTYYGKHPPVPRRASNSVISSSNVMDYNEDTRVFFMSGQSPRGTVSTDTQVRKTTVGEFSRNPDANEVLAKKERRRQRRKKLREERRKRRKEEKRRERGRKKGIKAMLRDELPQSDNHRRHRPDVLLPPKKLPVNDPRLITLHSPTRVYVPIWNSGADDSDERYDERTCVRCPVHMTLLPSPLQESVLLPVPAISICSGLARRRGRLNLAVTSGPRPGTPLTEGEYPIVLIAWKKGTYVSSCRFTVTVKVRKCPEVHVPSGVYANCSHGVLWGSVCRFSCLNVDEVLHGATTMTCEQTGDGASWSEFSRPVCLRAKIDTSMKSTALCNPPPVPLHGTIVCGVSPVNGQYSADTICQYFCFPGYSMASPNSSAPFICQSGRWMPPVSVTCEANYCTFSKRVAHGVITCDGKKVPPTSKIAKGAVCTYGCEEGYVVPTSQLHLVHVQCMLPEWNSTQVPDCRTSYCTFSKRVSHGVITCDGKKVPPTSQIAKGAVCTYGCEEGYVVPTSQLHLVRVQCMLPGWNSTKVPDCRKALLPRHFKYDCHNQTFIVEPGDTLDLRPHHLPRFVSSSGKPLSPTCTLFQKKRKLERGLHFNKCQVNDSELRTSKTCSYYMIVREKIVPQPFRKDCTKRTLYLTDKPLALKAARFHVSSDGQESTKVIRGNCTLTGKPLRVGNYINNCSAYDPALAVTGTCTFPVAIKTKFLPKPYEKDCANRTLYVPKGETLSLKPPRFIIESIGQKQTSIIKANCSLTNQPLTTGDYVNHCSAEDPHLGGTGKCSYSLSVKLKIESCPELDEVPNSILECTYEGKPLESPPYRPGTECEYVCDDMYFIPSKDRKWAKRKCGSQFRWNVNKYPVCKSGENFQLAVLSDCRDRTLFVQKKGDLITLPIPKYLPSTEGGKVDVQCSLNTGIGVGKYTNVCKAKDLESGLETDCVYHLSIEMHACPPLEQIDNGYLVCTVSRGLLTRGPLTSMCSYECNPGYWIAGSDLSFVTKVCLKDGQWNDTTLPTCSKERPTDSGDGTDTTESTISTAGGSSEITREVRAATTEEWSIDITTATTLPDLDDASETTTATTPTTGTASSGTTLAVAQTTDSGSSDTTAAITPTTDSGTSDTTVDTTPTTGSGTSDTTVDTTPTTGSGSGDTTADTTPTTGSGSSDTTADTTPTTGSGSSNTTADPTPTSDTTADTTPTSDTTADTTPTSGSGSSDTTADTTPTTGSDSSETTATNDVFTNLTTNDDWTSASELSTDTFDDITDSTGNVTSFEDEESTLTPADFPLIEPECDGQLIAVWNDTYDVPVFLTSRNTSAEVTCSTLNNETIGVQEILCDAIDPETNATASCRFNVTITDPKLKSSDVIEDPTTSDTVIRHARTPEKQPPTSIEVTLQFSAYVENCNEKLPEKQLFIKNKLLALNNVTCSEMSCNGTFQFICDEVSAINQSSLLLLWTFSAPFKPEEYENDSVVPEAETSLKAVLQRTHEELEMEEFQEELRMHGLELRPDTYNQTKIRLICEERGFAPDDKQRCVQCPAGTAEIEGRCEKCPPQTYQDKTGQTKCLDCLTDGSQHPTCTGITA